MPVNLLETRIKPARPPVNLLAKKPRNLLKEVEAKVIPEQPLPVQPAPTEPPMTEAVMESELGRQYPSLAAAVAVPLGWVEEPKEKLVKPLKDVGRVMYNLATGAAEFMASPFEAAAGLSILAKPYVGDKKVTPEMREKALQEASIEMRKYNPVGIIKELAGMEYLEPETEGGKYAQELADRALDIFFDQPGRYWAGKIPDEYPYLKATVHTAMTGLALALAPLKMKRKRLRDSRATRKELDAVRDVTKEIDTVVEKAVRENRDIMPEESKVLQKKIDTTVKEMEPVEKPIKEKPPIEAEVEPKPIEPEPMIEKPELKVEPKVTPAEIKPKLEPKAKPSKVSEPKELAIPSKKLRPSVTGKAILRRLKRKPTTRVRTKLAAEKLAVKNRVYSEMSIKMQKTVRKEELKLLREGIKIRSEKDKIISQLKNKAVNIADIKKTIYKVTKDVLPVSERGKLLATVASAKTRGDLAKAYSTVIKTRNSLIRKNLIGEIETVVEKIESVPLKWQDRITTELEGYSFKGMTKPTVEKLTKLREFLQAQPEAGLKFGLKTRKVAARIPELSKKNISDMPLRDLMKLHGEVVRQHSLGKLVKGIMKRTAKMEQERTLKGLVATSRNMDVAPPRRIAQPTTGKTRIADTVAQIDQDISNAYQNYVSIDIGFEILDKMVKRGRNTKTFKEPFDEAYLNFKEMRADAVDPYFKFKADTQVKYKTELSELNHKLSGRPKPEFTDTMMERIMIHATRVQEGGMAKLKNSGLTEKFVNSIELAKPELELYRYMRQVFDDLHPFIDRVLRDTHSRKLGKVKNYFSWQTDFNNSDMIFQRLENDYVLSSRTRQGFTKQRVGVGTQQVKMNAEEVFLKHVDDSTYFINTEGIVSKMGQLARDPAYQKAVGKNGQKWVATWIDLMARKGIPEGYKPTVVTQILHNIGAGILGFRLSPVAKQPLAKITSAALLGRHTFKYDAQYFSRGLWEAVDIISKQQRFRAFDDPAFEVFAANKKLAKWQQVGYQGIKWVDKGTANSVWYAAYRKFHSDKGIEFDMAAFKAGKPQSKAAVQYADYITRRTQGSAEYKDLAGMLTGKSRNWFRSFLQFQSFILNESYLIPHDAINVAIRTEKNYGKAMGIITAYVLTGVAEDYISTGIAQLFSSEKYAKESREKEWKERVFDSIVTKIPFINNVYSAWKYDSTSIPLIDVPQTAFKGGRRIVEGKRVKTKLKGATRLLEATGEIVGIPGAGQAGQIARKIIDEMMEDEGKRKLPRPMGKSK